MGRRTTAWNVDMHTRLKINRTDYLSSKIKKKKKRNEVHANLLSSRTLIPVAKKIATVRKSFLSLARRSLVRDRSHATRVYARDSMAGSVVCVAAERTRGGHHWRKSIRVSRERTAAGTQYTRDGRRRHDRSTIPLNPYIFIRLAMGLSQRCAWRKNLENDGQREWWNNRQIKTGFLAKENKDYAK